MRASGTWADADENPWDTDTAEEIIEDEAAEAAERGEDAPDDSWADGDGD